MSASDTGKDVPSTSKSASTSVPPPQPPPRKVEDDDDLDDLDDVLDEFNKPPVSTAKTTVAAPQVTATTGSRPVNGPPPPPNMSTDDLPPDFAEQLAANMEELLRDLGVPGHSSGGEQDQEEAEAFKKVWEELMMKDMDGMVGSAAAAAVGGTSAAGSSSQKEKEKKVEDKFQDAIKQAMEKLKESDESAKASSANASDPLSQLLASMGDLGDLNLGDLDAEGADGGEGLQSMLEGMMSQLMSKEILYEPLKELDTKFPEYLTKNAGTLSDEDKKRYKGQQGCVSKIVAIFEETSYSEEDAKKSAEVLRLMNEMQALGSPPSEIMGPLPPGMQLGEDGLPNFGQEGCTIA